MSSLILPTPALCVLISSPCTGHCPSGWDRKYQNENSTDCFNVTTGSASRATGMPGSLCYQECSNQGICDYSTGVCNCFKGRWGGSCEYYDGYVPPIQNVTIEVPLPSMGMLTICSNFAWMLYRFSWTILWSIMRISPNPWQSLQHGARNILDGTINHHTSRTTFRFVYCK